MFPLILLSAFVVGSTKLACRPIPRRSVEAVQRQEVVGGSEPPCHADACLPSLVVSQRQSAPAEELSGVVDKLLSLQVSQRQSAPADELSGVVDELLSLRVSQRQSIPADELSGVVDELLSLRVSQRQPAPADELSGVVDERRCRRLTQSRQRRACHRVRK